MTYRTSRLPYEELKKVINELHEGRETLILHTENPRRLCYRLREALHCCQFHENLVKFVPLIKLFAFETHFESGTGKHYVRARYRGSDEITNIEMRPGDNERTRKSSKPKDYPAKEPSDPTEPVEEATYEEAADEIQHAVDTSLLEGVVNLSGIIEGAKRYGVRVLEVYYPDAVLSEEDKGRLFRWTSENGWLIVDMEDAGLTLSKKDIPEEVQWKPKEN